LGVRTFGSFGTLLRVWLVALLLPAVLPAQSAPLAVPYTYRNVAIVAGGFITGFVAQPGTRGLYYVRTDIGGAYRWDAGEKRWSPLLDWLPFTERNLLGVESFAIDPTDAKRLYLAVGTYVNGAASGAILRSSDQGRHFETIKVPFKMGANNDGRFAGERLQVDPNHPDAMLMGTREDGLWSSADRGMTWRKVSSFRDVVFNDDGLTFVAYDRSSGAAGSPTPVIFVGMANPVGSLARSDDNGRTWKVVAGGPSGMFPNHGVFAVDGTLYLSYTDAPGPNGVGNGGVWAYTPRTGKWRDVTPEKPTPGSREAGGQGFGYGTVAVDPEHAGTVLASTIDRWRQGDTIFRSTDGGAHWVSLKEGATRDSSLAPWTKHTMAEAPFGHWLGAVMVDPFDAAHVLYGTGETIWESGDVTGPAVAGETTHWVVGAAGLEETADITLLSPMAGGDAEPHLFTGLGDIGCFRNDDLARSPSGGAMKNPELSNCDALAMAAGAPQEMVRVGRSWTRGAAHGAVSHDGGVSWTPFATEPPGGEKGGDVAISADGKRLLWAVTRGAVAMSADAGASWKVLSKRESKWLPVQVLADARSPEVFWSFDEESGQLWSIAGDGVGHPVNARIAGAARSRSMRLRIAPETPGTLWLGSDAGLLRSEDGGVTFAPVPGVAAVYAVGFGQPAAGARTAGGGPRDAQAMTAPAIYLAGALSGTAEAGELAASKGAVKAGGIYRSLDDGKHWQRIDDAEHRFAWVEQITGDPRVFGRVFLGTNGRGVLVGEPGK
jgi:hypothetical protein